MTVWLFCVHNSINFDPQRHWLKWRPKAWQRLHRVLKTDVETQCCTFILTTYINNYLNQKCQIWIYHTIRHVATDFQSGPYLSLFALFPFPKNGFMTAPLVSITNILFYAHQIVLSLPVFIDWTKEMVTNCVFVTGCYYCSSLGPWKQKNKETWGGSRHFAQHCAVTATTTAQKLQKMLLKHHHISEDFSITHISFTNTPQSHQLHKEMHHHAFPVPSPFHWLNFDQASKFLIGCCGGGELLLLLGSCC